MAIGNISGPMLASNLVRNGLDLSIESHLLYFSLSDLDPINFKIGVNTESPAYLLDIAGTTRSTNIKSTIVDIGNININANTVKSSVGNLILQSASTNDNIVLSSTLTSSNNVDFTGLTSVSSLNKLSITAPTTSATLTIVDGQTLTINNSVSFTGTSTSSVNFGTGGTIAYKENTLDVFANTTSSQLAGIISDETGSGSLVFATSPVLTTPLLGVATATTINKLTITPPATGATIALVTGSTLATSGAYSITLTSTADTTVTLPTTGTLVNSLVSTLSSLTSVGTITTGTWSGSFGAVSGANLISLSASNLSGTIPATVLGNSNLYLGTTAIALNRTTGNLSLSGVLFDATSVTTSFTLPSGDSSLRPGAPTGGNIRYNTASGYFEGYNGSNWGQVGPVISGSGLNSTPIKTSNYTANLIDLVRANSIAGSFNITFPTSPVDGSVVAVMDVAYTFAAHPVSIIPGSGNTIEGVSDSFILDINGAYVPFVYIASTTNWRMEITPTV
jgi:hypothetical protein